MTDAIDAILAEHDQTTAERGAAYLSEAMAALIGPPVWDSIADAEAIRRLARHDEVTQSRRKPTRPERPLWGPFPSPWTHTTVSIIGGIRRWASLARVIGERARRSGAGTSHADEERETTV